MCQTYAPVFLSVIGPGAEPKVSLQTRSIPTLCGGGEPSAITTLPWRISCHVSAVAGGMKHKMPTAKQTPETTRMETIKTPYRTRPMYIKCHVMRKPWACGTDHRLL